MQYEQVVPTRESNALIGGLLTVDENRADIPSITERTDSDPDFLEVDGIGLFGDDFSKKIQDEITSEKINQFPTGKCSTLIFTLYSSKMALGCFERFDNNTFFEKNTKIPKFNNFTKITKFNTFTKLQNSQKREIKKKITKKKITNIKKFTKS